MADAGQNVEEQFREITECPICMSTFNDPRVLPCIHTFCLECLTLTSEVAQKNPGDKMLCPMCRKEFIIPEDGMNGVQKNFFMENLLEFKTKLQFGSVAIICDICKASDEGKKGQIPKATMRCLECQDNYCDSCLKVHQFQELSRNHKMVNIGGDTKPEVKRPFSTKYCSEHTQKPLDYYCADCKKIVCVSCFVESHASHKCIDVTTVQEEFRQTIQRNSSKVSIYADEMLSLRKNAEVRKADFLKEIVDKENTIHKINQELKDMIDEHKKSLLDELSIIKSKHLMEMETGMEEIERYCTILRSVGAYCTELISKGSASDICSSVDELVIRADELERDHEAFIGRPYQSIEVSLETTDLKEVLQKFNKNVVGIIQEPDTSTQCENCTIVLGISDGPTITRDVVKINLHRSNEISIQEQIPTKMMVEAFAAVYHNMMYVTGVGDNCDEIWKYRQISGWMKCSSLVQGRRRHSAAFIDEVLYVCGGFADSNKNVLDSVEPTTQSPANAPQLENWFSVSIYQETVFHSKVHSIYLVVQIKIMRSITFKCTTQKRTQSCTLMSSPMPRAYCFMRAALWETSVILLGQDTCFIFNFETETWQERKQFKTDVFHFGLALENGRVFVIGGGTSWETDKDGINTWKCRDDVRYAPLQNILDDKPIEWKIHATLPKPSLVCAFANMSFLSSK